MLYLHFTISYTEGSDNCYFTHSFQLIMLRSMHRFNLKGLTVDSVAVFIVKRQKYAKWKAGVNSQLN
jgi:hypothetical protein